MEWYLTDDRMLFAETADKYAAWAVANIAVEAISSRTSAENFNWEMVTQAGLAGFLTAPLPEELGGAELDALGRAVVLERAGRGLAGPAVVLVAHWATLSALMTCGGGAGVESKLGALAEAAGDRPRLCGSAVPAAVVDSGGSAKPEALANEQGFTLSGDFNCTLHPSLVEGLVLPVSDGSGQPQLIWLSGEDLASQCAEAYPGTGLLEVPLARVSLRGQAGAASSVLAQGDAAEQATGELRRALYLGLAAIMVGNAAVAVDYAREYATERFQTGRPIIDHQDVRRMLENMATMLEAARAMVFNASSVENLREGVERTRRAYSFAGSACEAICLDAVQCLGGYGYMKDYGLERRLRDNKTIQLLLGSHSLECFGESW